MAGLYLHIPYCRKACLYCDFHFSTQLDTKSNLVDALIKEIELRKDYVNNEEIKTIYFGGGTPSVLSDEELKRILVAIYNTHSVNSNAEITLEANPDDLTVEKIKALKALGINRLSIGLQSFL
jgi:oxygen-independent coproporphyrinogen-3 oxidase